MKIFDFKFLILLAIAIVIYFLYKELEQHRIRIHDCENKIKLITNKQETTTNKQALPSKDLSFKSYEEEKTSSIAETETTLSEEEHSLQKVLSFDETLKCPFQHIITLPKETIITKINTPPNISNHSDEKSITEQYDDTQQIVEIYSNDNDNKTSISDTLLGNKELDKVLNELKNDMLNELEQVKSPTKIETHKYELHYLQKLKLAELQNIAKENHLLLDKNINGNSKRKTKQELINELNKL